MTSMRCLACLLLCTCGPVCAEVRHCVAADGTTVFTDRRCEDIGAVERRQQAPADATNRPLRAECPRTLHDLVVEVTTAIDTRDINRLAGVYAWSGMSNSAGYAVMDRLQAIVDKPLVDIVPVYPGDGSPTGTDYYPQDSVRRTPVAMRLEQTLSNGTTPSRTVLGLRRGFGCWWVAL
jgi:hypothetical protein